MSDSEQPYVFRVEHHGVTTYVAGAYMGVHQNGIIWIKRTDSLQPVATFCPCPGLSVIRVDTMITSEGLMEK